MSAPRRSRTGGATRKPLDPITFELIDAALRSAAEEMGAVLKWSSYSPIIREMDDFSCAIFEAGGDLVAQADFIPAQLGAMSLVVQSIIRRWEGSIADGDVFIANHPFMGAMHTPDINILLPVFVGGRLFAWTGTTAHHLDVGGVNPGTEGPDLEQVYAEGLVLAPVRLYRGGEENPDVFTILTENVRDPRSTVSDLRAQGAACRLGRRRLEEAVERYGARTVREAFRQSLDAVERATRLALSELADGEGEAEGFLDDDGRGGPPTRIHARLEKRGDSLIVDLSGTAPQIPGALNVPWASTRAGIVYVLRALTDPDLPTNDGVLRAVQIVCPPGNVLNPRPPAAVSVRHNTCQRLADTLIRAAAEIWPEKAVGSSSVGFFGMNIGSQSPVDGRASVMSDVVGGGTGAHRAGDGLDGVDTYMSNVGLMPVEVAEAGYRVRILRTELIPGSQGAGEFAGGLGLRREYQILDVAQKVTFYSEQTDARFAPRGALGGRDGSAARITVLGPDGAPTGLPMKATALLQPGSIVRLESSGGGGFGDPSRRSPASAESDRRDGRVPQRRPRGLPRRGRRPPAGGPLQNEGAGADMASYADDKPPSGPDR